MTSADGEPQSGAERAATAYRAQQTYLYRVSTALYLDRISLRVPAFLARLWAMLHGSTLWPFSQATAAALDLSGLPSVHHRYGREVLDRTHVGLAHYWDGTAYKSRALPPLSLNSSRYYDDNAWIGLDLVRAYRLTADTPALERAQQVFGFIITGWHDGEDAPAPGGVFWVDSMQNRDRNTCSNGPNAELALRLYQVTGQQFYLDWARKIYGWVNRTLLAPNDLYWDRIDLAGNVEQTQWSYNQGTMIGAGALLYSVTGDLAYQDQAARTARAALDFYARTGYFSQPPAFNAIFFRNLLHLSTVDPTYLLATLQALRSYAAEIWQRNRKPGDLFVFPSGSPTAELLDQAAVVQVHACLDWDATQYDLLV